MALTAADVMKTDLITLTPSTPLLEAARIFSEDRISGAPVVEIGGKLLGVVSKTDLLARLLEGDMSRTTSSGLRSLLGIEDGELGEMPEMVVDSESESLGTIDEIMATDLVTVTPRTPLGRVANVMTENRIHRVLVKDRERLVGLITSLDVLAHFARR